MFSYSAVISHPMKIGPGPRGVRNVFALKAGKVWGPKVTGKVLPVGGEFQLTDPGGNYHIDVRMVIETDDEASIFMHYTGVSAMDNNASAILQERGFTEFGDHYFVTQPRFECGHEKYKWLNTMVCVAEGRVSEPWTVEYRVYGCSPTKEVA